MAPKRIAQRFSGAIAACLLLITGCSNQAPSSSQRLCESVGGTWEPDSRVCGATGTNAQHISVVVTAQYPEDLIDAPISGPTIKQFLGDYFTSYTHPDDQQVQDGSARLTYARFEHSPNIVSVVFTNNWHLGGPHPNDAITTFTFDLERNKVMQLTDLLCDRDAEPLDTVPALVRPYVQQAVAPHPVEQYEPGPASQYTDDYRSWYLDGADLVLLMPSARIDPAHAGQWQPRMPLTALQRNCPPVI